MPTAAEFVVVNCPLAGSQFAIGSTEFLVGRDPNSRIVLPESDVGWRHCVVRKQGSRFLVRDLRSSLGTYVNGMRSPERWLEDRDEISIGKTILLLRSGEEEPVQSVDAKPSLLIACSLVYLFRAIPSTTSETHQLLQNQIIKLVGDLIPVQQNILCFDSSCKELQMSYSAFALQSTFDFAPFISRVCEEGGFADPTGGVLGAPIYDGAAELAGVILVRVQDLERPMLDKHWMF